MFIFNEYPLIRDNVYMVHRHVDMNFVNTNVFELLIESMFNGQNSDYINYVNKMGERITKMQNAYGIMQDSFKPVVYVGTFPDTNSGQYLSLSPNIINHLVVTIGGNDNEPRLRKIYADELKFFVPRISTEGRTLDATESNIMNKVYSNERLTRQLNSQRTGNLIIIPEYERLRFTYEGDFTRKDLFEINYKTKEIKITSPEAFSSLSKKEINYINTALLSAYNVVPCMFVDSINGYELTLI